jgi:hypothetical protein
VDQEAARRRPVCDDALGTNTESGMRVLLVGGHPSVGVTAPAELGERAIETLGKDR